jgi:AcrR family transcriptional regulator
MSNPAPGAVAAHENKLGQLRGPKGTRTRQRIMDATTALLRERPFGDIAITEVARASDIAQPNFYTYFGSIEEVVLAIARGITTESLAVFIEQDWAGAEGVAPARQLVEAALQLWGEHRAVISLVNVLADKMRGDFPAVRVEQMRPIYKAFEKKIRVGQAAGLVHPSIQPRLAGYECVSLIGSAGQKHTLLVNSGFSHKEIVETTAHMLHMIATGRRAPG